jgi:dihydroorotate dehydrogenase (fumarate)
MVDLSTTYMGMKLPHPIVASASPLSESVDNIKRMEDAGAAAVVMYSLFEEQIKHEAAALAHLMSHGTESFSEALSYFPEMDEYHGITEHYLEILHRASESVNIPIIASLNGISNEGWINYAKNMQEAGARGIELNIYYIPADITVSGREVEERYLEITKAVKSSVTIPVALKLSAYFSSLGDMARQFDAVGADALVLFNRFWQPDFDIDGMEVEPTLHLSSKNQIRIRLLWIALLYGRIQASLAASTGVHTHVEVVKYLMAGADAVMTTSALLRNGIEYLTTLREGLKEWMEAKEYASVAQMKGCMSQQHVADPTAFERASYIRMLEHYKNPYVL